MKKLFFSLFFPLWGAGGLFAQATVTPVSVDYDRQEVTFHVAWNAATAANNRVWVWVDFCSVAGATPGTFAKADIGGATVTAGSIVEKNTRGFYVTATPNTVTVKLNNASGQFNWCAYGSDYPPNILDYIGGTYTLRGTPPFTLKDANGNTQEVAGTTITQSSLSITPITMTDETGCPGYFCKYVGMDLHMNASYPCQQRTGGAQNWQAYIKDARDNELYRIVLMPDNHWWLAQNIKLAGYNGTPAGAVYSNCNKDECGRGYSSAETIAAWGGTSGSGANKQGICPPGWVLPLNSDWINFIKAIEPSVNFIPYATNPSNCGGHYIVNASIATQLNALNNECHSGSDTYGWATKVRPNRNRPGMEGWWCGIDAHPRHFNFVNHRPGTTNDCNNISASYATAENTSPDIYSVRCFRQL
ncbi:MAG: hypothetical protein LBU42_01005 [Prevotellaceae bacterium]|jgi:uncharacterized protein (TIGR02145 family)|nr:hypothetical protein [Prevotellaceae bacterium]